MKINLLPKEERPLKQSQVRWEFLVGLLGFLLLAGVLVFSWVENARFEALAHAYQDALARQELLQRQVQGVNAVRQEISALESREQLYQQVLSRSEHPLTALPEVSNHSLDQLWIEAVVCTAEKINVAGYTRDVTALSSYLNQLQTCGEEAELTHITPLDGTDFQVFGVEVKGVRVNVPAQLN